MLKSPLTSVLKMISEYVTMLSTNKIFCQKLKKIDRFGTFSQKCLSFAQFDK